MSQQKKSDYNTHGMNQTSIKHKPLHSKKSLDNSHFTNVPLAARSNKETSHDIYPPVDEYYSEQWSENFFDDSVDAYTYDYNKQTGNSTHYRQGVFDQCTILPESHGKESHGSEMGSRYGPHGRESHESEMGSRYGPHGKESHGSEMGSRYDPVSIEGHNSELRHRYVYTEDLKHKLCENCRLNKVRSQKGWYRYTVSKCEACDVPLCKTSQRDCFRQYHKYMGINI